MSVTLLERPAPSVAVSNPMPSPCEDRAASPCAAASENNWVSQMLLKSYVSSFNFCLGELGWVPQRILEVGSGDGSLLSYAAQTFMNAEVLGVEFDADKVAVARERNCCRVQFMELLDTETLPFEAGSFDLVISHGFLGNSPIPRHWLKEMARVTAEAMIVSAPTPLGFKWLKRIPGLSEAKLLGNPVFDQSVQPIAVQQMKSWIERLDMKTEAVFTPLPYAMMLSRKRPTA